MFGLTRQGKDDADPLQTAKSAAEWFRALPALDVMGRQEHVVRALTRMREVRPRFDLDRVAAILFLDDALTVDRRRLLKWYFENLRGSTKFGDRFWQAARDVTHGFIHAMHEGLETGLPHAADRRWKPYLPRLTARLIHAHGVDIALRLFRGERAMPAKWAELHALFLRACEQGFERAQSVLPGEDPLATHPTVEHEYVHVLLIDQLRTGNLTPAELDWASTRLHAWSRDLALETSPTTDDGFFVDLAGTASLTRRDGKVQGTKVGYLDTAPLMREIERAIAALQEPDPDGKSTASPVKPQRLAILEKIRPALSPTRLADLRRHPRVPLNAAVDVRIGLARIAHGLASPPVAPVPRSAPAAPPLAHAPPVRPSGAPTRPDPEDTEEIEIRPLAEDAQFRTRSAASNPGEGEDTRAAAQWRVSDRSAAGWRISAPGGLGQSLVLGALVAVRLSDAGEWTLGMVSRLVKGANNDVEAGMSLIASRVVPVTLHGRRRAQADMNFVVDGIDISTVGTRFEGLYLMPPSRLDTRLAARTLIIPASEYFEGRHVVLTTAHSNYAVTLGHVIDQRADWSWVTMEVSAKAARGGK